VKESGDAVGAAERYKRIAESKDPAHGEEAAFRRVALIEDLKQHGQATVPDVLAGFEDYFRLYPAGTHELELRERYAGYLFDEKRYADALVPGAQVVARATDPAKAQKMKLLLARAAFAAGDYFQCANWATQLLSEPKLPAATRGEVEGIHAAAIYKGAEALKDKPFDAAAQYELLVRLYPRHKTAPPALYNAAVLCRDGGDKARALALFRRLVDTYPAADVAHDATISATALYKEMGDASGAADLLEKAGSTGASSGSEDLLFEAGVQAQAAKSPERTISAFEKFLRLHHTNDLRSAQARIAVAKAQWQLLRAVDAERLARETVGSTPLGVSGEDAQKLQLVLAEARFLLGEAAERRFSVIRVVEPVAKNLKLKQAAMEEVVRHFTEAASYGFADVSLASTYKIGYAQLDFANGVMQAPRPRNLSPTERVQYEALLRDQVGPYRQAAEKAFRTTLQQGKTAGVENEWTARARFALGEFGGENPQNPPVLPGT
jgi:tetratricopeptide (TPR) repeat protein